MLKTAEVDFETLHTVREALGHQQAQDLTRLAELADQIIKAVRDDGDADTALSLAHRVEWLAEQLGQVNRALAKLPECCNQD